MIATAGLSSVEGVLQKSGVRSPVFFFGVLLIWLDADTNIVAWKASRLSRLGKLRGDRKIGPKLHAKALKATAQVKTMDEGIALAFMAYPDDKNENEFIQCLHGLLASEGAISHDPADY